MLGLFDEVWWAKKVDSVFEVSDQRYKFWSVIKSFVKGLQVIYENKE